MAKLVNRMESSAIKVLTRAVSFDSQKKYAEALVCYQEGIQLLLDTLQDCDEAKRKAMRVKVTEYMDRAEQVKVHVEHDKTTGKYHEVIQIEENDTGYDYERLFKRLLGNTIKQVTVEDPYIASHHQIYNFLRFCEVVVKHCPNVKAIDLVTSRPKQQSEAEQQTAKLDKLSDSLKHYNVTLSVKYTPDLHDREIRMSNGWIIKIGRGLDIFKPPISNFSISHSDLSLRPCRKTTINIFHSKHTADISSN